MVTDKNKKIRVLISFGISAYLLIFLTITTLLIPLIKQDDFKYLLSFFCLIVNTVSLVIMFCITFKYNLSGNLVYFFSVLFIAINLLALRGFFPIVFAYDNVSLSNYILMPIFFISIIIWATFNLYLSNTRQPSYNKTLRIIKIILIILSTLCLCCINSWLYACQLTGLDIFEHYKDYYWSDIVFVTIIFLNIILVIFEFVISNKGGIDDEKNNI